MDDSANQELVGVPVTLASGRRAVISAVDLGGEERVSSRVPDLASVLDSVKEMCHEVANAMDALPGKRVNVEFGVAFGMESGQLITLLAKASLQASLKVSIELSR
jgi:hypothetical protein